MIAASYSGKDSVPACIEYQLPPFQLWSGKNFFPFICWSGPLLLSLAIPRVLLRGRLCAELVGSYCSDLGEQLPSLPPPYLLATLQQDPTEESPVSPRGRMGTRAISERTETSGQGHPFKKETF